LVQTLNGARAAIDLTAGAMVAGSKVTTADVAASNGVIHVIDKIMMPPSKDIVGTAVAAGSFTKLAGALVATGLDKTLQGAGPFTVFAPTDDAFAAFETKNPGVLASLTTAQLSDILLYHVVSGWAGPADLKDGASVNTALAGKSLKVSTTAGVKVNESKVTSANIVTTNGVIHVIDAILLPPTN
jgi:transforming growth factor-beta-induced protein